MLLQEAKTFAFTVGTAVGTSVLFGNRRIVEVFDGRTPAPLARALTWLFPRPFRAYSVQEALIASTIEYAIFGCARLVCHYAQPLINHCAQTLVNFAASHYPEGGECLQLVNAGKYCAMAEKCCDHDLQAATTYVNQALNALSNAHPARPIVERCVDELLNDPKTCLQCTLCDLNALWEKSPLTARTLVFIDHDLRAPVYHLAKVLYRVNSFAGDILPTLSDLSLEMSFLRSGCLILFSGNNELC